MSEDGDSSEGGEGDAGDGEDRKAILSRRARFVAAALYGLSLGAGCDTCLPGPCLSPPVPPGSQTQHPQPGEQGPLLPPTSPPIGPPTLPTPCLEVMPAPCLQPIPLPCLSEARVPDPDETEPEVNPPRPNPTRPTPPQPCLVPPPFRPDDGKEG